MMNIASHINKLFSVSFSFAGLILCVNVIRPKVISTMSNTYLYLGLCILHSLFMHSSTPFEKNVAMT